MKQFKGEALLDALELGEVRVAERAADGSWTINAWVKEEILALFRSSPIVQQGSAFRDKQAFPVRNWSEQDGVRVVPGGSAVRRGAYLAPGVVCMPPMYVNVGAYVGAGTMIDSHALVGSCAQIGEKVHLSAAAQIGGVLEPANARPVIVEDECFVGGNTGIYEGVLVRKGAVIAAGVILTASTPVFDLVNQNGAARHARTSARDSRARGARARFAPSRRRVGLTEGPARSLRPDRQVPRREDRPRDGARERVARGTRERLAVALFLGGEFRVLERVDDVLGRVVEVLGYPDAPLIHSGDAAARDLNYRDQPRAGDTGASDDDLFSQLNAAYQARPSCLGLSDRNDCGQCRHGSSVSLLGSPSSVATSGMLDRRLTINRAVLQLLHGAVGPTNLERDG